MQRREWRSYPDVNIFSEPQAVAGTSVTERREVRYTSLDELRADVEALSAVPCRTVGNWSFGKILMHLAMSIDGSFDGFPFKLPWPVRKLVAPFFKRSVLYNRMKPGLRLPKRAREMLPAEETTVEEGRRALLRALDRFGHDSPRAEHAFLGALSPDEWVLLHLRHAELHMSFVRPVDG